MLSEKQEDFVLAPFRHTLDVAEGTPRSGKTTACVLRYFLFLNLSPDTNHLIVGATQTQAFAQRIIFCHINSQTCLNLVFLA